MTLRDRLAQAGIEVTPDEGSPALETPWFVRALQAFSGWLAALFLLGFLAMGAVFVLESSAAAATLGLVMIAGACIALQKAKGDFLEHLALAASLAGQLLVAWAVGNALGDMTAGFWWSLLVLQVILAMVMPSLTHRSFSAFAASLALYLALAEGVSAPSLAGGLVLLALVVLFLNEFRWPTRVRAVEALGLGLLLGLVALQVMAYLGQPQLGWHDDSGVSLTWLEPWAGNVLGALALLLLLRQLFMRHAQVMVQSVRLAAYGAVVLLLLLSLRAHGLIQGAAVMMLGFAIGHRLVMGSGVLLLLLSIANYYYWLEATLLAKALTLFAIGVVLLAVRWALRRGWPIEGNDEDRADAGEGASQ
ncbi:DUF4401 domain-containing protein [Halomonas sp. MCCC 1A17488]|uniref:DUF4401 domain-containing protein n=1 Tax=unclassified Halomonas TaxID=2609666 RepID=UPI0018D24078|nr:DUF4401 domain-containing protein [Halomonas sp. SS10-MC5]MCE8016611.1 DUF4401 domain-containing protein [Halomonas sp. MCCC 1A17488]MCG3239944.1 DUF4401 domain-containing protein [Halomonas sp. MCCC 1A17488]QPP50164.1 DUF4401 domain-containing protein [Halomonas sp. SS10-MC5]